jgi:flavin reductase (DIM6/NTAB) family NADH-FMN oxidoreductase RutF
VHLDVGDPVEFRRVLARCATGVVVVTVAFDGVDHAMTANSFTSVSLDPPLVLVCVERRSRFHSAVTRANSWAVSILGGDSRDAASWFATRGRPLRGQFSGYPTTRGSASGALLLDDALGRMECVTEAIHPGGDHDIVVGRVVALELADDGTGQAGPLIYYRHGFRSPPPE